MHNVHIPPNAIAFAEEKRRYWVNGIALSDEMATLQLDKLSVAEFLELEKALRQYRASITTTPVVA